MIGAIIGDIIGSAFEWQNVKTTEFPLFSEVSRFTDDTVLTVALADSILSGVPFVKKLKEYYRLYPNAGYGGNFAVWASSSYSDPYNSWGNGSAMRVSPVGFACSSLNEALNEAERSAAVTHNHPEGIKGAQAAAGAIYMARAGSSKEDIKDFIESQLGYNLSRSLDEIRPSYSFDVSCQGSVPEAIIAFLESEGFEDAVRKAISIGGDSDTIACITGGIAQAYYKEIPEFIEQKALDILDDSLKEIISSFRKKFSC